MSIFKGQGKSGITGKTVQATVNKHKQTGPINDALKNYAQSPKGGSGAKTPKTPPMVGTPNMEYPNKMVKY